MIENRVLTFEDYGAMLRRRLKVILVPTLLAPLLGFIISYAFPARYMSQALVLVQDQQVPQGYVAPVVTQDLSQRIATLEQKALGADRLRPLIDRLTQQGVLHGGNPDEIIERIRDGVSIEPVQMVMVSNPVAAKGTSTKATTAPIAPSRTVPRIPSSIFRTCITPRTRKASGIAANNASPGSPSSAAVWR